MGIDAFYIDIEDSSGNRQGAGPIWSANGWTYTARMDRAGSFAFSMPASDDMAEEVQKKRVARAYALLGDTWTEVGAGIIDNISKQVQPDGTVVLNVSGESEERELTYRSVGFLELESGSAAITHSAAVTAIAAYAPSGWTITADTSPGNDSIYGRYAGESVLQALVALGEKSQSHFYRSGAKALTFAATFADSGVRAIRAGDDLTDATCAILDLQEQIDTHELITRIYPYGAGQGRARLTLAATARTGGGGYTLNAAENYILAQGAAATYGRIEQYVEYKDIAPVSNTDADVRAAANMLYDVALEELKRRSTELEQATYTLSLGQCRSLLRPLQTMRVVYWDPDADMDVDADLNILEATLTVDAQGLRTTSVVVSNSDRWPDSDSDIVADSMAQGMVFQAHPQMNCNSYTTGYKAPIDIDENASVYFRLGDEVVQVQQVAFDFQLLPFESTIRSVAAPGTTGGSGELETQAAAGDTGSGGNNDTGSGGGAATGSGGGAATGSGGGAATGSGGGSNTGSGGGFNTGLAGNNDTGSASPVTGGTALTTSSSDPDTGSPQGGDIVGSGRHIHIIDNAMYGATYNPATDYYVFYRPSTGELHADGEGSTDSIEVTASGDHTHEVASHTHTTADHTHTIAAHTHTTANHSHTNAAHTHTTAAHTHTTAAHTHTTAAHTHTTAAHTHTTAAHTHSLNNHAHAFDVKVETLWGIYREASQNTLLTTLIEYRVNSGDWQTLSANIESLGGDWYRLDVTDEVVDSDTLRPLQAANEIEFRHFEYGSAYALVHLSAIEVEDGVAVGTILSTTTEPEVGDRILIVDGGTNTGEDGIHVVTDYNGTPTPPDDATVTWSTTGYDESVSGLGLNDVIMYPAKTVMIDGLLTVRNIIQAIAYT